MIHFSAALAGLRMPLNGLTLATVCLASLWPCHPLAQQDCCPIHFPAGRNAADITGVAPAGDRATANGFRCYSLAARTGQHARIRVMVGRNVAITIPGIGDARDTFEFVTQRGTYELLVFQLFPGGDDEPFRISVTLAE